MALTVLAPIFKLSLFTLAEILISDFKISTKYYGSKKFYFFYCGLFILGAFMSLFEAAGIIFRILKLVKLLLVIETAVMLISYFDIDKLKDINEKETEKLRKEKIKVIIVSVLSTSFQLICDIYYLNELKEFEKINPKTKYKSFYLLIQVLFFFTWFISGASHDYIAKRPGVGTIDYQAVFGGILNFFIHIVGDVIIIGLQDISPIFNYIHFIFMILNFSIVFMHLAEFFSCESTLPNKRPIYLLIILGVIFVYILTCYYDYKAFSYDCEQFKNKQKNIQ